MNNRSRFCSLALLAALSLAAAPVAFADTVKFKGALNGASEVPPKSVSATGTLDASLDTQSNKLHYKITYSGLTGDAVAAHFHGPATPGVNAAVVVGMTGSLASPIEGDATLTPEQAADLLAGKWYFNVHTAANKGGEIRTQVERAAP